MAISAPVSRSYAENTSASPPAPIRRRSSNRPMSSTSQRLDGRHRGHATVQQVAQQLPGRCLPLQERAILLGTPDATAGQEGGAMVIEELDPAAAAEWDAYVSGKEAANCYHLHGWRIAGERGYGLRAPYLVAGSRPRGELLGALPFFFVRSPPLRGYATTGLFGSYGPLLAEDARIAASLLREACRRARDAGLASFRFKGLGEEPAAAGFIPLDHWVVATLPLWASPEQAWAAIRGKERSLVRKARGYGLEVQRGPEGLAAFYDVLADNMHHKGAPIYGRGFIEELLRAFPGAAEVVTVNRESRCVAGAVTITFKGVMAIPFLSSRPDSLWLRPNVLLVWDIISRPARAGEAVRVIELKRRRGYPTGALVAAQLAEKGIEAISLGLLFGLCALLPGAHPPPLAIAGALAVAAVVVLSVLPRRAPGVGGRFLP